MFDITNLQIETDGKKIVKGVELKIKPGEIHAIMGPNGSGKSSFANAIMGNPRYPITGGDIKMNGKTILGLTPCERAKKGIFLAFQHPKEIPGVSAVSFLSAAVGALSRRKNSKMRKSCNPMEFRKIMREKMAEISMDEKFMARCMNENFSGGEKKKMEILQMMLLQPKLAVLDEIDSGLDIDALIAVSKTVKELVSRKKTSVILITHYQRILRYIKPQYVHVMLNGAIVKSDGPELGKKVEKQGYKWLEK